MKLAVEPLGELVTIRTATGRQLDGIYYHAPAARATGTIVHVHGSFGNFYHNPFVRVMAGIYQGAGFAFLSFNLSAHDGLAEGYVGLDDFEYVGGAVSGFGTSVGDIDAAIAFGRTRLERPIVLQGHSLGCDRVLDYLIRRTVQLDFVLLSPCDSYALQCRWIAPETVESQIERLQRSQPARRRVSWAGLESADLRTSVVALDWLPLREYGIRCGAWSYPIPITRRALLEILSGPPLRLLRLDAAEGFRVSAHGFVYIGGADALQTCEPEQMFRHLEVRADSIQRMFVKKGDHGLINCEAEVGRAVIKWAKRFADTR